MQAGDLKLGKVFANDHQSVIPLFQRPYIWDQDDNWNPLWQDIRKAAEEVASEQVGDSSDDTAPTYFLGAVVVQQRRKAPKRLSSSNIIDGQQRMTTLQVLIASARAVAHSLGADKTAGRFSTLVENRPETIDDDYPTDRYKVWPLPQDRDAFLWAVRSPGDAAPAPDTTHRLVRARLWFEEAIADWAQTGDVPAQRLDDLHFALEDRMQLVEISLDSSDDPQVIFEALNHRGVRLAAADLVKNLLFQLVEKQGDGKRAEELLTTYWLPLDGKYWRGETTTGRIRRALVDLLLTYWLAVQTGDEVIVDHLFADFKKWTTNSDMRAAGVIEDLRHYADTYQHIEGLPLTDPTGRLIDSMKATGVTTPWPVLLFLHANDKIPSEQRARASGAIESFLMRRGVPNLITSDYNRLFVLVLNAARQAPPDSSGDAVVACLAGQTADSRKWPTDDEFLEALTAPGLYDRMYRARLKALLVGLENRLRTEKTEPEPPRSCVDSKLNIEHVLPQKWEKNWALPPEAGDDAVLRREDSLHRLGNLTLTTSKLNSTLSNHPWPKKKAALREHSLLRLTTSSILNPPPTWTEEHEGSWSEEWNERRIVVRGAWLADHALRCWPRPDE